MIKDVLLNSGFEVSGDDSNILIKRFKDNKIKMFYKLKENELSTYQYGNTIFPLHDKLVLENPTDETVANKIVELENTYVK